ncbi:hypothetical protein D3C73_1463880 [compost metagenome]
MVRMVTERLPQRMRPDILRDPNLPCGMINNPVGLLAGNRASILLGFKQIIILVPILTGQVLI